ncbi:MAG TPA: FAD-dependent oxidoreductase, partial [Steroidobacteraceae bacterium]|nr:FAD-dependent oxidoreductase [Steroidobacteraceae bacterium]
NYARALEPLRVAGAIRGIRIRDELTGEEYELRSRAVINAAGPWVDEWVEPAPRRPLFCASKAFNLVARRLPFADAVGFSVPRRQYNGAGVLDKGTNTYFVIPWNGRSLIGTRHIRCEPAARASAVSAQEVQEFLNDLNQGLAEHRVAASDITGVFSGLLPEREDTIGDEVVLGKTARVVDHGVDDRIQGLYSIVGIKWTTARAVAERAVKMAGEYLHRLPASAVPRLNGYHALASTALAPTTASRASSAGLDAASLSHLEEMYGPNFDAVLELIEGAPALRARIVPDMPVMAAQIVHAVRAEMAYGLTDVVRRRTPLYLSDALDDQTLGTCAGVMERELGWSAADTASQLSDAKVQLRVFRGQTAAPTP